MQTIEQQAFTTYQDNLKYFEEKHPDLYKKLITLDTAINTGVFKEHYSLEYMQDTYFDIKEISSGEFLYGEDSNLHAQIMTDNANLLRTGSVFKAQRYHETTDEEAQKIQSNGLSFHNIQWATVPITHYVQTILPLTSFMQQSHKTIFIDTGLGIHIEKIINKLKSKIIFIKEKNLEIFRLSLFVTNYAQIAEKRVLFFSVADTNEQEKFLNFLNHNNQYNLYIKYIAFSKKYIPDLRKFQEYFVSQTFIGYGYHAELLRYITSPKYLVQGYPYLNVNKVHTKSFFANKPVLLVMSGPSSLKNIHWIQKHHNRFILIAALSTCRLLSKYNIAPDITIHIDPGEATSYLFNDLPSSYFQNTTALLSSNVNEDTIQRFNSNNVYIIEQGTSYKKGFGMLSAPSVGEYTYALSLILGATNIFMVGIDLALDNETLQTHGEHHAFSQKAIIDETASDYDPKTFVEYTKGNFLEKVPTTAIFKVSINQFTVFTNIIKKNNQTIFNLSDGAYLEGSTPLKIDQYDWDTLDLLKLEDKKLNLDYFLKEISEAGLNQVDKNQFKKQMKGAKKLEQIIKIFQSKNYTNADSFLLDFSKLTSELSANERTINLADIYNQYLLIIKSYIFDLFNVENLENEKQYVEVIQSILVKELLKIASTYLDTMQMYIKNK